MLSLNRFNSVDDDLRSLRIVEAIYDLCPDIAVGTDFDRILVVAVYLWVDSELLKEEKAAQINRCCLRHTIGRPA